MRYGIHITPAPSLQVSGQLFLSTLSDLFVEANGKILTNLGNLQGAEEHLAKQMRVLTGRVHAFEAGNIETLGNLSEHISREMDGLKGKDGKILVVLVERDTLWTRVKMWFEKLIGR